MTSKRSSGAGGSRAGTPGAGAGAEAEDLFTRHYDELHRAARQQLALHDGGAAGQRQPFSARTLVHETFLRMAARAEQPFQHTNHFIGYAAHVMRGVIVDHARAQQALKRGREFQIVTLDTRAAECLAEPHDIVRIDEYLLELEAIAPKLARIVEMRFFGGLDMAEIAGALGCSERTVHRDWEKARGLLSSMLRGTTTVAGGPGGSRR